MQPAVLGGGRLIAASDSRGGVMNEDGLDPEALVKHKLETGAVNGFPGSTSISDDDLPELDVDVLYQTAPENVTSAQNAVRVKAKISCELANGPTTPEADEILHERGVFVDPGFLANAGGSRFPISRWYRIHTISSGTSTWSIRGWTPR